MEKEKIISEVLGKVGNTDVSPQTVEGLINLNPLSEGTEPDDAYFDKLAGVVRSFQGNINHVFSEKLSAQVNEKLKKAETKTPVRDEKPKETAQQSSESSELEEIKAQLKALQEARQADIERGRRAEIKAQVKSELKERFRSSGMEVRDFFIDTALSKMEIDGDKNDISELTATAEKNVVHDMKAAGIDMDAPTAGGSMAGSGKSWLDKKFAEKAIREGYAQKKL